MNILVTGAAGFIGYFLSRRLLDMGHSVTGIDEINDYYSPRLKTARLARLGVTGETDYAVCAKSASHPGFRFVRLRLEDREGLERQACATPWKIPFPTWKATCTASSICWSAAAAIR